MIISTKRISQSSFSAISCCNTTFGLRYDIYLSGGDIACQPSALIDKEPGAGHFEPVNE